MRKEIYCILVLLLCISCSSTPTSEIVGSWARQISLAELGLSGEEQLNIEPDGSFSQLSLLKFEQNDSIYLCTLPFAVFVSGRWAIDNATIILEFDSSTYRMTSKNEDFHLTPSNPTVSKSDAFLTTTLCHQLVEYFDSIMMESCRIQAQAPVILSSITLRNDTLAANINYDRILWVKHKD